jgi:glycosyltransferase involved in cell wall biosynthesis
MFARCGYGERSEGQETGMRVAFDTRPSSDPHGLGRYARCLLEALRDTVATSDEVVAVGRPAAIARSRGADVFHAPWMAGAMLHSPCPMVVTVHGLAALKRPSEHLRMSLRLRLRNLALQRAACVIVPTQAVAEDVVIHLGVERERIEVIAEAADPVIHTRGPAEVMSVRARYGLPERYLLWVGGLEHPDPTRRVAELAATTRELPLVLVGSARPWAHELPGVILTGRVRDDELAAIYTGAHALLLPSEREGCGLSAVEALACGTPVVAFESPALREVLGERATFVAPPDLRALVDAAQAARRPAPAPPSWTWQDAARATWRVYARALAEADGGRVAVRVRRRGAHAGRIDGLEPQ